MSIKNCKSDIVVETPGGLEAQKKDIAWIKRRLKKWIIYLLILNLKMELLILGSNQIE